jgi:hypothetical protein
MVNFGWKFFFQKKSKHVFPINLTILYPNPQKKIQLLIIFKKNWKKSKNRLFWKFLIKVRKKLKFHFFLRFSCLAYICWHKKMSDPPWKYATYSTLHKKQKKNFTHCKTSANSQCCIWRTCSWKSIRMWTDLLRSYCMVRQVRLRIPYLLWC